MDFAMKQSPADVQRLVKELEQWQCVGLLHDTRCYGNTSAMCVFRSGLVRRRYLWYIR